MPSTFKINFLMRIKGVILKFLFRYDENFRKSLVKTVPAIEPLLNQLIPEEKQYPVSVKKAEAELKSKISKYENKLKEKSM